ncbi:integral membrane sensor signal transduction histidine kinase, partial [human gut metagenome]
SHELKTPITSMKVLADSLLGQQGLPEELYQEFLHDISKEIDRENDIITDLLALVRMEKSESEINISSVNINEILEAVLKRLKPIAESKNIELIFESFRPVIADVDELKFASVATNLVENAIKYNNTDGTVTASLNSDHQYFYLKVTDTGIGISEENQDRVFERFFRVDKARS